MPRLGGHADGIKREEDRLTTQHDVLYRICGDRLYFPRVDSPRKILDCGYGGGDWVVQVAEEFEDCEVRCEQCSQLRNRFRLTTMKGYRSRHLPTSTHRSA